MTTIRRLGAGDRDPWIAMRAALFPDMEAAESSREVDTILHRDDWAAFGAVGPGGDLIGFIEIFERNYAEGCDSSPVPYIEALWVADDARRRGVARQLVEAVIAWARARGRPEIASDVQLGNFVSQATHTRLGFAETERLVTYRMAVDAE